MKIVTIVRLFSRLLQIYSQSFYYWLTCLHSLHKRIFQHNAVFYYTIIHIL